MSTDAKRDDGLDALSARIQAKNTKTHQERWVPFRSITRSAIYDYLAFERGMEPGRLFLSSRSGKPLASATATRLILEIAARAKVKVSAHDFRRSFVERLQSAETPVPDTLIMRLTGHKGTALIARYGKRAAAENAHHAYRQAFGT